MMHELIIVLKVAACFLALFGVAELLYHFAKLKAEHTRKIVHIGTGMLTLLFPIYFEFIWQVVVICSSFLLLLLLSLRFNFLQSINNIDRKSFGSILYPIIVTAVFIFYKTLGPHIINYNALVLFYIPILVMALADPTAAFAGNYYKQKKQVVQGKTNAGSIAFFVMTVVVCLTIFSSFCVACNNYIEVILSSILIAVCATLTERISHKGWDNFTIPLVCSICLWVLSNINI